jgi:hypothetical protein
MKNCLSLHGDIDVFLENDFHALYSSKLASYAETDEVKKILVDLLKDVDRELQTSSVVFVLSWLSYTCQTWQWMSFAQLKMSWIDVTGGIVASACGLG